MQKKLPKYLNNCYWVTIDVGWNTGVALWRGNELESFELIQHKESSHLDVVTRMKQMRRSLGMFLDSQSYPIKFAIIEGVYSFSGSSRSSASLRKGDLFELAYLVGMYISRLVNIIKRSDRVWVQLAREWKGQLPDPVVAQRVEDRLQVNLLEYYSKSNAQHVYDAIGIGLNHLGGLC